MLAAIPCAIAALLFPGFNGLTLVAVVLALLSIIRRVIEPRPEGAHSERHHS